MITIIINKLKHTHSFFILLFLRIFVYSTNVFLIISTLLMCCDAGVWFMHCHFDVHLSWGLRMAWIVLDGTLPSQKLPPPPSDLPKC
jgi:hypothetical protein